MTMCWGRCTGASFVADAGAVSQTRRGESLSRASLRCMHALVDSLAQRHVFSLAEFSDILYHGRHTLARRGFDFGARQRCLDAICA